MLHVSVLVDDYEIEDEDVEDGGEWGGRETVLVRLLAWFGQRLERICFL